MNPDTYEFEAIIKKVLDIDGAYIQFPYDVKDLLGNGRVNVTYLLGLAYLRFV